MKACRAIKIVAFVLALLISAVAIAGNVLITRDAMHYNAQGVTFSSIRDMLESQDFRLLPQRTAEAEETSAPEQPQATAETQPTTDEAPANDEFETPVVDDFTAENTEDVAAADAYDLSSRHYLLISLMKASAHRTELGFLRDVEVFGSKVFDTNGFEVNTCLLIVCALLFVSFILHCISKKVTKTFYGILLFVLGYLLFMLCVAFGQFLANYFYAMNNSFDLYDLNHFRFYIVAVTISLGLLLGLPYLRCGSRHMRNRELKQTIKKLRRKIAH